MTEPTAPDLEALAELFSKMGYPLLASSPVLKVIFAGQNKDKNRDNNFFNISYPQPDPDGTIHAITLERKNQAFSVHSVTLTRAVPHDNPLENPIIYFRAYTEHYYIGDKEGMNESFKALQENKALKDVLSENIVLKDHLARLGFDPEKLIGSVEKPLIYTPSRFNALSLSERFDNKDFPDLAGNNAFIDLTLHNTGTGHFIESIRASLIIPFSKEKSPAPIQVEYNKSPGEFPKKESLLRELIARRQIEQSSQSKAYEILNTVQKPFEQPAPPKKYPRIS